jgi:hypothetical protein
VGVANYRPTYTAEQGLTRYGPLASDAAFCAVWRNAAGQQAGFINGACLEYQGKVIYQSLPNAMFQEDRTARPGVPARFRWQGVI